MFSIKRHSVSVLYWQYQSQCNSCLSGERDQSVAGVGLSLIEEALEYQEDVYFSRVADDRLTKKQKRIPHEKVWA